MIPSSHLDVADELEADDAVASAGEHRRDQPELQGRQVDEDHGQGEHEHQDGAVEAGGGGGGEPAGGEESLQVEGGEEGEVERGKEVEHRVVVGLPGGAQEEGGPASGAHTQAVGQQVLQHQARAAQRQ